MLPRPRLIPCCPDLGQHNTLEAAAADVSQVKQLAALHGSAKLAELEEEF